MNELKFSCPDCGQHIAADSGWSGLEVACPACAVNLIVPEAAGGGERRMNRPRASAVQSAVPPCGSPIGGGQESGRRLSKLSIACLVLCLSGIGLVPGLVCGHVARRRIRRDPALKGKGIALAGLIIGYAGLALAVALLVAPMVFLFFHPAPDVIALPSKPSNVSPAPPQPKLAPAPVSSKQPVTAEFLSLGGSPGWETIRFRVSNLTSKPITELTLRYTFRDAQGQATRETQMVKQIEPPLAGHETQELSGMAFAPPGQTKSVDITVIQVTFQDGTQ